MFKKKLWDDIVICILKTSIMLLGYDWDIKMSQRRLFWKIQ